MVEAGAAIEDTDCFALSIPPPLTSGFLAAKWLYHLQASRLPPKQEERGREKMQRTKLDQPLHIRKSWLLQKPQATDFWFRPGQGSNPHLTRLPKPGLSDFSFHTFSAVFKQSPHSRLHTLTVRPSSQHLLRALGAWVQSLPLHGWERVGSHVSSGAALVSPPAPTLVSDLRNGTPPYSLGVLPQTN